MKTVGIICEFNPFHNGHEYLVRTLRGRGYGRVICVMSGNAVQRGEPAMAPAHVRAKMALCAGADAVFELPFPWCCAGAEFFASAGIDLLCRLGVDAVGFGSESGRIPDPAAVEAAKTGMRDAVHGSTGTAAAYFSALTGSAASDAAPGPNDILAAEYAAALHRAGYTAALEVVPRRGSGYLDAALPETPGCFPSASALRRAMLEHPDELPAGIPAAAQTILTEAVKNGEAPVDPDKLAPILLAFWRLSDPLLTAECAECGGGVAARLQRAAAAAADAEGFLRAAATKKYTNARLRRAMLFGAVGVTPADLRAAPAYVRLLGAGPSGRAFVAEAEKRGCVPIVTKAARVPDTTAARRQADLSARLDALFTLALPVPREAAAYLKTSPVILS